MNIVFYLTLFSAFSFLAFGIACFTTAQMKKEFFRYGLASYRKIVGILQVLGGLGLLMGLFYSTILQMAAAAGLAVLMLLGFMVRLKIKDNVLQAAPSLIYAIINAYILYRLLSII